MKFKWEKDQGGGFALSLPGYAGYVEVAGGDLFGNCIVDATAIKLDGLKRLNVGGANGSFSGTQAAKRAVERAIVQAIKEDNA